ncbi:hypothetical protein [Enterovibrio norvegicus]|uniref:hypothetical protein n=1 Tax=Enterovibrio norvegicus TaxID=188144 RepID=UPI000C8286D4|nr:hypothetical protein [Enterovibrio norvegicus]PMN64311.1 hypothetical protein BCT27_10120 [Enterovibrio norvegicus]
MDGIPKGWKVDTTTTETYNATPNTEGSNQVAPQPESANQSAIPQGWKVDEAATNQYTSTPNQPEPEQRVLIANRLKRLKDEENTARKNKLVDDATSMVQSAIDEADVFSRVIKSMVQPDDPIQAEARRIESESQLNYTPASGMTNSEVIAMLMKGSN